MKFYRTLKERSAGGKLLAAYDHATYASVLEQIKNRKTFYEQNKNGNGVRYNRKRLQRLEELADALFQHLQHAPNGTIRFPLADVQTMAGGKPVRKDIPIIFSTITIKERIGDGIATHHFLVTYRREGEMEYGYITPQVKY